MTGSDQKFKKMKLLVVVQRYGRDVNGGAEQHARWLAEALAALGHEVHVLTTCARDYTSWANFFPPGTEELNGVTIHRQEVAEERDLTEFNAFAATLDWEDYSHSREAERHWLKLQGPYSPGVGDWLNREGSGFDAVLPFTYLYRTAHQVLAHLYGKTPIVMHATAHDEKEFYLPTIQYLLKRADHFLCSTPEEAELLATCGIPRQATTVVGIGVPRRPEVNVNQTLRQMGLTSDRFILILGRVDGNKGVLDALDCVDHYRRTTGDQIQLVVAGQNVANLESTKDTIFTGFVSNDDVTALLDKASCLVQPSPAESFSLVLCESWAQNTPTLATARSDVLVGQTFRSKGGLTYSDREEFTQHLAALLAHDSTPMIDLDAASNYVTEMFDPSVVTERINRVLHRVKSSKKLESL